MITIEEIILPSGLVNYSLSVPYDTGMSFHSLSKHHVKLNLESLVETYDFEQCRLAYETENEKDENGFFIYGLDYYVKQAPHTIEEGLFLHFSDDDESFLIRDSAICLTIDGKKYKLPCFFAPNGRRGAYYYTPDLYFKITPKILKELASATSISLSYITKVKETGFKDVKIYDFMEYALVYYEGYYIEHLGTPDEKEKLRQELQAKKDANKKREEEEKARKEQQIAEEKARKEQQIAEEKAARKAEWDEADPMSKVWIMLKRNWKLVLFILFILWCLSNC